MVEKNKLFLPALTGEFSNWRYYQVLFPVSEIVKILSYNNDVPNYRIKTVSEVEEIYTLKGVSNMLQRVFDLTRLEPLKNYLLKQKDRYINNLTLAIFQGNPKWLPIDLSSSGFEQIDKDKDESYWESFGKNFGIIQLNGEEILFVLDGQHRIIALREAVKKDIKLLDQKIAVTLISHENNGKGRKKTRRLFTTINRYAKPVSLGENILLDEDDLSSILTRNLIEYYPKFKNKDIIALNKTTNLILPRDNNKFTTVIELWSINELIIDPRLIYPSFEGSLKNLVRIRPNDKIIDKYQNMIFNYWNVFFDLFPRANDFLKNPDKNIRKNGGPLSLRPIGQSIFAEFYLRMKNLNRLKNLNLIKKIPDNVTDEIWHFVIWDPISQKIINNKSYSRDYLYYLLNIPLSENQLEKLRNNYKKYIKNENAKLPDKIV